MRTQAHQAQTQAQTQQALEQLQKAHAELQSRGTPTGPEIATWVNEQIAHAINTIMDIIRNNSLETCNDQIKIMEELKELGTILNTHAGYWATLGEWKIQVDNSVGNLQKNQEKMQQELAEYAETDWTTPEVRNNIEDLYIQKNTQDEILAAQDQTIQGLCEWKQKLKNLNKRGP